MSDAITRDQPLPPPPAPGLDDAIDEALAGLPAPPQTRTRVLGGLLSLVSIAAIFLAFQLLDDVRFAFASADPVDLGDARTVDVSRLPANRLVHVRAAPAMAGAVRYTRPLLPGEYTVFPVAGRSGEPLYVQIDGTNAVPGEFTGRLIPFDGAGGRYAPVGRYLRTELGASLGPHAYLIVAGATPRSLMWSPMLAALLLALAITDLGLLFRLLRPASDR